MSTAATGKEARTSRASARSARDDARGPRLSAGKILGIAVLVAVLAAAIWAVVYFTPLLALKHVEVKGVTRLADDDVVAAAGVQTGIPLAQVNTHDAAAGVASLTWVKSATASRSWPSTLALSVEENVPVAFIQDSAGTHLIDAEGREFAVDPPPESAVELTGAAATDEAARKGAVVIAAHLSEPTRNAVESIEARGKYDFVLHLKEGRTVVWGASEDNENKALAVDTVMQREGQEFNVTNPQQITSR